MAFPTPDATVAAKLRVAMVANKGVAASSLRKDRRAAEPSRRERMEDIRACPPAAAGQFNAISMGGRDGLSDQVGRADDSPVDQDTADLRAGVAGIAFHSVFAVASFQSVDMDHGGIDSQHLRGVADVGVTA